MTWATVTRFVVIVAVIILILYDIVALSIGGMQVTISAQLYLFAQKFPIVAFALGIVFGHLFWPNLAANQKVNR